MKVGRNDPCPCGSGKKYKHCCYAKDSVKHEAPEPAEPEETPSDEAGEEHAEAHLHKKQTSRHKDRSRFQEDPRGGNRGFTPRVTRGAQRGS